MTETANKQKLGKLQEAWLKALESGKYKQSFGFPYNGEGYTALGLASHLAGFDPLQIGDRQYVYRNDRPLPNGGVEIDTSGNNGYGHPIAMSRLGLRCRSGMTADWQHIGGANSIGVLECTATFKEIAALIREKPEAVFTEPR